MIKKLFFKNEDITGELGFIDTANNKGNKIGLIYESEEWEEPISGYNLCNSTLTPVFYDSDANYIKTKLRLKYIDLKGIKNEYIKGTVIVSINIIINDKNFSNSKDVIIKYDSEYHQPRPNKFLDYINGINIAVENGLDLDHINLNLFDNVLLNPLFKLITKEELFNAIYDLKIEESKYQTENGRDNFKTCTEYYISNFSSSNYYINKCISQIVKDILTNNGRDGNTEVYTNLLDESRKVEVSVREKAFIVALCYREFWIRYNKNEDFRSRLELH